MTIKRIGYDEVKIGSSQINTSRVQARQNNIDTNIDILAQSIEHQGLLAPVLFVQLSRNEYELISGQRRFKAYSKLFKEDPEKFEKIPAFIYENCMEEWEKSAISINENLTQEAMSETDKISAVTACYNQFGKMTDVSERTGISYENVRKYVKYDRLPNVLKEMRDKGSITLQEAIDAANLHDVDSPDLGKVPENEVKETAIALSKLSTKQKKRVFETKKTMPEEKTGIIIERVQKTKDMTRTIIVEVASDTYARVETFKAEKEHRTMSHAAEALIRDGLNVNDT